MRKFIAVFCLLFCAATLQAKDKPNPTDYNIKIHISATQLIPTKDLPTLIAETLLNGKKVKLAGDILPPPHGIHLFRPTIIKGRQRAVVLLYPLGGRCSTNQAAVRCHR